LNALRERWLNPPEWTQTRVLEFPGSVCGPGALCGSGEIVVIENVLGVRITDFREDP